jgi:hypothetical protein
MFSLFGRGKKGRTSRKRIGHDAYHSTRLSIERLENRRLLAIIWANEFVTSGPDNPDFAIYSSNNEAVARQIVNRAISDWNAVLTNFNYAEDSDANPNNNLNNTFNLKVLAQPLSAVTRGRKIRFSMSPMRLEPPRYASTTTPRATAGFSIPRRTTTRSLPRS